MVGKTDVRVPVAAGLAGGRGDAYYFAARATADGGVVCGFWAAAFYPAAARVIEELIVGRTADLCGSSA